MTSEAIDHLATGFFAAIERGDLEAVRNVYAPAAQIWHNVTGRTQSRDENVQLLGLFVSRTPTRSYELLSREFFADGFVQRHLLHATTTKGETIALHACLVVHVADGHIDRLYEYLDSAAVRSIFP